MRLLSVSTEALLTASGNIVAELQGSCSLRAEEMGGNGTKTSSVWLAVREKDVMELNERILRLGKTPAALHKTRVPKECPRIACFSFRLSNLTKALHPYPSLS
jgi:hypothetical protein